MKVSWCLLQRYLARQQGWHLAYVPLEALVKVIVVVMYLRLGPPHSRVHVDKLQDCPAYRRYNLFRFSLLSLPCAAFTDPDDHSVRQHFLLRPGLVVGTQKVLVLDVIKCVLRILIAVVTIISIPPTLILLPILIVIRTQSSGFMFNNLTFLKFREKCLLEVLFRTFRSSSSASACLSSQLWLTDSLVVTNTAKLIMETLMSQS